ncbi:MAG: phosphate ABC transporter substrate-binding protein PstS [Spirochaetia bacterium]|nr:phosphate ABC transporter substrate-binding protein PstS [Spirochaetia bacterium]
MKSGKPGKMKKIILIAGLALASSGVVFAGKSHLELMGAGATFPYPLYQKMFDVYAKVTGVKVNYQAVGSGAGIKQFISKTVDFGGTDAPMNANELSKAGGAVIHVPTCIGAIVLSYNIPGLKGTLKLSPEIVSGIYLGAITKWNDSRIVKLNPGANLPDKKIAVVHRADSSGTTYNFTVYLSSVSPEWKQKLGIDKNPKWPVGLGGKGNAGVAAYINQVENSIGYIEIAYAMQNNMSAASLQNKSGRFIDGHSFQAIAEAANIAIPADGIVNIVDTSAANGYSISATTWIILYKDQSYTKNKDGAKAVVDLVWWMIHEGQSHNESVGYAKLPVNAVKVGENLLRSVVFDGKPLFTK